MKSKIFLIIFSILGFLGPFSKIIGQNFTVDNTTISYDDCSGITTVRFPISQNAGWAWSGYSCAGAPGDPQMQYIFIEQVIPGGSTTEIARVIWDQLLGTYPCNGTLFFPKNGDNCSGYRICGNAITFSGDDGSDFVANTRYITINFHDLDDNFFGNATKIKIRGRGPHGDFDHTFTSDVQKSLGTPVLSSVSNNFCTFTRVTWTNSNNGLDNCSNSLKYTEIQRSPKGLNTFNSVHTVNFPVTSWDDYYGLPGQQFDYRVRHFYNPNFYRFKYSEPSGVIAGNKLNPPPPPSSLAASTDRCDGGIRLTWLTSSFATSYKVYRNGSPTPIATVGGSSNSYLDSNPITDQNVSYQITSVNECGSESALTDTQIGFAASIPPEPSNVTLSNTPSGFHINWTDNSSNETSFIIERSFNGGGGAFIIEVPADSTHYFDNDVSQCVTYSYTVKAKSDCKPNGVGFAKASGKLAPDLSNAFATDGSGFRASKGYFTDKVELSWTNQNAGQTNTIKLYRRVLNSLDSFSLLITLNSGSGIYNDPITSAAAGVLYEYEIVAEGLCENVLRETNRVRSIGFRTKAGQVQGRVSYAGGVLAVEGVKILAESTAGTKGRSLSLSADSLTVPYQTNQNVNNALLIESWIQPQSYGSDFDIAKREGSYRLKFSAATNQYEFSVVSSGVTHQLAISTDSVQLNNWTHIAGQLRQDSLFIYVNGHIEGSSTLGVVASIDNPSVPIQMYAGFNGYATEMRIWNISKPHDEIFKFHSLYAFGSESGLILYLPMTEGTGAYAYDRSRTSPSSFNRNHAALSSGVLWSLEVPTFAQLSFGAYTNSNGNYILTLPYTNAGENYDLTPIFLTHQFSPPSKLLFVGDGSTVINNIDFTDVSSFRVTGTLFYKDTNCPVEGAFLAVDGQVLVENGSIAKTQADGSFDIQVPIGRHYVSVEQPGPHVYSFGRFPTTGTFDFQEPLYVGDFKDSTLVKVIGRVAGGVREKNKLAGLGRTKNNIGVASFRFMSQNNCYEKVVTTDALTGEYTAYLPPLKYDILDLDIVNTESPITFESQSLLDIENVPPVQTISDTLSNNVIESVEFQKQLDFIYRAKPNLDVQNQRGAGPFDGDSILYFTHSQFDADTLDLKAHPLAYPAFQTGMEYKALISTFEEYINYDGATDVVDRVPVLEGEITINNSLSSDGTISINLSEDPYYDGDTLYTFRGNIPNTEANTNVSEISFTETFLVDLSSGNHDVPWKPRNGGTEFFRGYLFGVKPIQGTNFVTQGPEIVEYILRDPPSSQGYSELKEGVSISKNVSWSIGAGATGQFNKNLVSGVDAYTGFGYETGVKIQAEGKFLLKSETVFTGGGGINETTTITESYKTSDVPRLVGAPSDLFISSSRNYNYGLSNTLKVVPEAVCGQNANIVCFGTPVGGFVIGRELGFLISPEDYETKFAYSAFGIETYQIPELTRLRNQLLANDPAYVSNPQLTTDHEHYGKNNDDPSLPVRSDDDPLSASYADTTGYSYTFFKSKKPDNDNIDRVRQYNQQIRLWKEALALNEEEKALVTEGGQNRSFDGGGASQTHTISTESVDTRTFDWELSISEEIVIAMSAVVAGSGASLEQSLGIKQKFTANETNTTTTSKEVSYTFSDDSEWDRLSVSVYPSLNGFGPIFKTVAGQTSCPYEDEVVSKYYMPGTSLSTATVPIDRPTIDINPKVLNNVPQDELGALTLTLGNESIEAWEYEFNIVPASNPNGLRFNVNAGGAQSRFRIGANSAIDQQLFVTMGTEYLNDSLLAVLYSTCQYQGGIGSDPDIVDSVYFSVNFLPGCSAVNLQKPKDQWVLNNSFNNVMPIEINGYNINYFNLERLVLEYKSANESSWSELQTYWKDTTGLVGNNILPIPKNTPGSFYSWDVSSLGDGAFDLRARSVCFAAENESEIRKGYIDRVNPHSFGTPSPGDGILDPNDDILLTMNEKIDIGTLTLLDFDVRGVLNGSNIRHETSLGFDGVNDYALIPEYQLQSRSMTIEFWLKRSATGQEVILSQSLSPTDRMVISFDSADKLKFQLGSGNMVSSVSITDQEWHHYAIVYDRANNNAEIFIDFGQFNKTTKNNFGANYNSTGSIYLGKDANGSLADFRGFIHELRFWSIPKTEAQIAQKGNVVLSGRESGLIGNWPLDDGYGLSAKEKVRSRHAQVSGATWSILPQNHSFMFNGTSDYLVADNAGTLAFKDEADLSFEAWFKTSSTSIQTILSNGKADGTLPEDFAWSIYLNSSGALVVENDGAMLATTGGLNDGIWHHFSIVVERTRSVSIYIDGQLRTTGNASIFKGFAGPKLWIGARGWFEQSSQIRDRYFNGKLDDIRVWNSARKSEQVARDFLFQLRGDEPGLQAYYPFDGVINDVVRIPDRIDASPNVYDLNLGGTTVDMYSSDAPPIKIPRLIEKVDITYSVNNDQIYIEINEPPARVENVTLDITVKRIKDIAGNTMQSPKTWIAYINKNQVFWEDEYFKFEKKLEDPLSFKAKIKNTGGRQERYSLGNLPSWLTAIPSSGIIEPNSTVEVNFTVQPLLNIGEYEQDIFVTTESFGFNERLLLDLKVTVDSPAWAVNDSSFSHSMNIIGQFHVNNVISVDDEDIVSVWVNNELRGSANVMYDNSSGKYLVFLTVHSNVTSGEILEFRAWDASEGRLLVDVIPNDIVFLVNDIKGTRGAPIPILSTVYTELTYQVQKGWTWLSFPLAHSNLSNVNSILSGLKATANDEIKSQTKFNIFDGTSWSGSLPGFDTDQAYKLRSAQSGAFKYAGTFIDPSNDPIAIKAGWNWIGVKSEFIVDLASAMASLDPQTGDLIKGQRSFAIYEDGFGWGGSLQFLEPKKGYMLKYHMQDELIFPGNVNIKERVPIHLKSLGQEELILASKTGFSEGKYSGNMSMIASISACQSMDSYSDNWYLVAYAGNESRGYVKQSPDGKFYLTIDGDVNTALTFRLVNSATSVQIVLNETIDFAANNIVGMISTPYEFSCGRVILCDNESMVHTADLRMDQIETLFKVDRTLMSDAVVPFGHRLLLTSGGTVELLPPFEVVGGAQLEVLIADCIDGNN